MLRTTARTTLRLPALGWLAAPGRALGGMRARVRTAGPLAIAQPGSPARPFLAVALIVFVLWLAGVAWAASLAMADRSGGSLADADSTGARVGASDRAPLSADEARVRLSQLESAYVSTLAAERASDERAPAGADEVAAGVLGYSMPPKTAPKPPVLVNGKFRAGYSALNTAGQDLYDCANFATWEDAQAVYRANLPGDPNGLDANGNGIACDTMLRR